MMKIAVIFKDINMKNLIVLILLVVSTIAVARPPQQDTLYVADMSGNDTIIWLSRSFMNFKNSIRIEFEYTTFGADDAYIRPCSRSITSGPPLYYNTGTASTDTAYVLNVTSNLDAYSGKVGVRFTKEIFFGEEFGFYFNKGSVTNDTLIYNYRQR